MSSARFDPFNTVSLRDAVDRLLEDSFIRPSGRIGPSAMTTFPMDIYETDEAFMLDAELPGVRPEDVQVQCTNDSVVITGERLQQGDRPESSWLRQESTYGKFQRAITLPVEIDPDEVDASYQDGILHLVLPKSEQVKPRKVEVRSMRTQGERVKTSGDSRT